MVSAETALPVCSQGKSLSEQETITPSGSATRMSASEAEPMVLVMIFTSKLSREKLAWNAEMDRTYWFATESMDCSCWRRTIR